MLVCAVFPSANHGRRGKKDGDEPENFLIPNRFPGEPPWFLTVPPARLVAVLTDPRPLFPNVSHCNKRVPVTLPVEKGPEVEIDCSPRQRLSQVMICETQIRGCVKGEDGRVAYVKGAVFTLVVLRFPLSSSPSTSVPSPPTTLSYNGSPRHF